MNEVCVLLSTRKQIAPIRKKAIKVFQRPILSEMLDQISRPSPLNNPIVATKVIAAASFMWMISLAIGAAIAIKAMPQVVLKNNISQRL
ncbi:hypothetical protein D3C78_1244080 [compost metagenome]